MNVKELKKFLDGRPAINREALAREAGITGRYLAMILNRERPLTDPTEKKLIAAMKKYGYTE